MSYLITVLDGNTLVTLEQCREAAAMFFCCGVCVGLAIGMLIWNHKPTEKPRDAT